MAKTVCDRCIREVGRDELRRCEVCERDGLCTDCYRDHGCEHELEA
jgi:hypothetical protein